jgi:uncharacterized membrane protein (UPF0127 family)
MGFGSAIRALTVAALLGPAGGAAAECREDRVSVLGDFGRVGFSVEVADEPAERSRGLMFVAEMDLFEGMLFVYERPQRAWFWMRNTLIPLDMLFADATGTITRIHANAVPLDETPIDGGEGVRFVLEINGGMAERLGIAPGDRLQHPAIGPGAAAPCP